MLRAKFGNLTVKVYDSLENLYIETADYDLVTHFTAQELYDLSDKDKARQIAEMLLHPYGLILPFSPFEFDVPPSMVDMFEWAKEAIPYPVNGYCEGHGVNFTHYCLRCAIEANQA